VRWGIWLICLAGCTLDATGKDHCYVQADCNRDEVCNESGKCEPALGETKLTTFATDGGTLVKARALASATVVDNWLYVLGGVTPDALLDATIERAPINPDDTLGPFDLYGVTLRHGRAGHRSFVVANQLCVIGGSDDDNAFAECARFDSQGELGAFEDQPSITTKSDTNGSFATVVIRPYVYVLGGFNDKTKIFQNVVERVVLGQAGGLGDVEQLGALQHHRAGATAVVLDDNLFVLGGIVKDDNNPLLDQLPQDIERASINGNGNGNVGDFTVVSSALTKIPTRSMGLRIGRTVHLLGGSSIHGDVGNKSVVTFSDHWAVTFDQDESVSVTQQPRLGARMSGGAVVRLGKHVFILGGQTDSGDAGVPDGGIFGTPIDTIEHADIE
jgi:hypothetical protein